MTTKFLLGTRCIVTFHFAIMNETVYIYGNNLVYVLKDYIDFFVALSINFFSKWNYHFSFTK